MKPIYTLFIILWCFFTIVPMAAAANPKNSKKRNPKNFSLDGRTAQAYAIEKDAIELDGRLDELDWSRAPVLSDFIQQAPDEGAPATENTEVRILYTQENFYVGIKAYDSKPDSIRSILARRDSRTPSDWLRIYIDSYHDHRSAFEFAVNPAGVKRDVFWSNDRRPDDDWDAVWDVAVHQDGEGWSAEFQIPFSQIRFPKRDFHTWGFQVARVIARNNETSFWCRIPKGVPQFCSLFGDLKGIEHIPSPKRLQLLPYSLGKGAFEPAEEDNPFSTSSSFLANTGLDVKYGLTSNLTLDATFNPDFGQVEADPAQVNLSAYETYFREKRPFFMEGSHMLDFRLGSGHERDSLFYSRRIGRQPQGDPTDAEYYQRPENTTILGAAKLTGKTSTGWSIGLLEALTGSEQAQVITTSGQKTQQTVEPLTNYFVGKIEKEFRDGRSAVGMIFTAVNRNIQEENLDFLRKAAYSSGLSFRHRWAQDTYEINGSFLGSQIRGSEEAIESAQTSSARYFQRPDATHLELDPTRTSLAGYASMFSIAKIGGGHWRWSIGGKALSPGFEVNDIGYLREVDSLTQHVWLSYREYKPGKIFREYDISYTFWNSWDYSYTHEGMGMDVRSDFRFLNYWNINLSVNRSQTRRSSSTLRGGPAVLMPGSWRINSNFRTDSRKALYLNLRGNISLSDNGAKSYGLSSGFNLRPSDRIILSLSPNFNDGFRNLQYVTEQSSEDQTHYILSRIDQTTVSLTIRLSYTITPNLTLQLYTQPYISAGDYSEFKEVIDPLAENYADRWHIFTPQELSLQEGDEYSLFPITEPGQAYSFSNPDFNFRQFRLNLVLRWEYLPGSTLYLVWANGMNSYTEYGGLSLGDDLHDLFSAPANNIFLLKFSYWFSI